jgi:hypothetical protein
MSGLEQYCDDFWPVMTTYVSMWPVVHLISGYRWAFFGLEGDNVMLSLGVTAVAVATVAASGVRGRRARSGSDPPNCREQMHPQNNKQLSYNSYNYMLKVE